MQSLAWDLKHGMALFMLSVISYTSLRAEGDLGLVII